MMLHSSAFLAVFGWDDFLVYLAVTAVSMALSAGAQILLSASRKQPKTPLDHSPPMFSNRGSYVPIIMGRRRVGPVVAWVGKRKAFDVPVGGGGGGFSGGGTIVTNGYAESAMHVLCVGPVDKLIAIYVNGRKITTTALDRGTTTSGSVFHIDGQGAYAIYWGEPDQPVNAALASSSQMGIGSRWPNICYVHWNQRNLHNAPLWPQIEYEIEARQADVVLTQSAAWFDESAVGAGDDGLNPAHALWQLLTAAYPHGAGIEPDNIDSDRVEFLGAVAESEHASVSLLVDQGRTCDDVLAALCDEMTWAMPQKGPLIAPHAVRAVTDETQIPTLDSSVIVGPVNAEVQQAGPLIPDRLSYLIPDRSISFKPFPIIMPDDASAIGARAPKRRQMQLETVIDRTTGYRIALRKTVIDGTPAQGFKLKVNREARLMIPGQAFHLAGVGICRVSAVDEDLHAGQAELSTLLDAYTYDLGLFTPDDTTTEYGSGSSLPAVPDTLVVPFNIPTSQSPGGVAGYIGVARIRGNDQIVAARVQISVSGTAYLDQGTQDKAAAGGTLNSPMDSSGSDITLGPTITVYNADILGVLDLSSNGDEWAAGRQVAIIGTEAMFVKRVTAVSGGYRLEGIKRGKYGTTVATHADDDPVVIFDAQTITPIKSPVTGATISIKTIPSTATQAVDPASVTPVTLAVP